MRGTMTHLRYMYVKYDCKFHCLLENVLLFVCFTTACNMQFGYHYYCLTKFWFGCTQIRNQCLSEVKFRESSQGDPKNNSQR